MVEFAKEHFPEFTRPVFADKRFESVIDDGTKYVAKTDRRFDVIIVDSTDPQGPGKMLFGEKFYPGCKRCLKKGGVLVTQNGVPFFQQAELASTMSNFRKLFADATCYVAAIPTYVGGHMAMGLATDNKALRARRPRPSRRATARPAALRPNTGPPRSTSPPSRCRASSPTWWPRQNRGAERADLALKQT